LSFIRTSKSIGCYAVKFQLFKIESLFTQNVLNSSKEHKKRKKWELPLHFLPKIREECDRQKIKLGFTPFYLEAVDILKPYVDFFKIGSYEILWKDLFKKCAQSKKPVIFSTGMAKLSEIKNANKILKKNGCKKISILHCMSEYPASFENSNLFFFKELSKISKSIGWSDHTKNKIFMSYICNNYNLDFVEFHLDLDKYGNEHSPGHCWLPNEINEVITFNKKIKTIKKKRGPEKKISLGEIKERNWRTDNFDGLRPLRKIRKLKF
jgi:N-acetylneuraminate synthase